MLNFYPLKIVFLILISSSISIYSHADEPEEGLSGLSASKWQSIENQINKSASRNELESTNHYQQNSYIKASNTGENDRFGISVSLSGDTLAIAGYKESSNSVGINGDQDNDLAVESGAVYIFIRENGDWSQQAYIKASNVDAGDFFGSSISLSGDTLAVGAYLEDSNSKGINLAEDNNLAEDSGAVYVFTRTEGIWSQQAYIKSSNSDTGDRFGYYVSIEDDTLAVGANYEDSSNSGIMADEEDNLAENAGAAYVFTRVEGVWTQQAYLKASNTDAGDLFGHRLAYANDMLVVAAIDEDSNSIGVNGDDQNNLIEDSGAVYLFTRSENTWTQEAYLKASNPDPFDSFGQSLAVSNDMIAVGAWLEDSIATGVNGDQLDNSGYNTGAAYIFRKIEKTWSQEAYIKASAVNNSSGDFEGFGFVLDFHENFLVVGSFWEDSDATGVNGDENNELAEKSGAAYIYKRINNQWHQQAYLKPSNTRSDYWFGYSVDIYEDTLICGSVYESSDSTGINGDDSNNLANKSGAVYTFNIPYEIIYSNGFD